MLNQLDINHKKTNGLWMIPRKSHLEIELLLRNIESDLQQGIMPDLTGMILQDAIFLLENYGLIVDFKGFGSIYRQSISRGDIFKKGSIIKLELS